MRRRWLTVLMAVVLGGVLVADTTEVDVGIPDGTLLQPADLDGAHPIRGATRQSAYPLPPAPCGGPGPAQTRRWLSATYRGATVYEYLGRYPSDRTAGRVVADLRDQIDRCGNQDPDPYRLIAGDVGYPGAMLIGRDRGTYYVGHARDLVIVVLVARAGGDPTVAATLGQRAMARGGAIGSAHARPRTAASPRWVTFGAEVTGVRPGPDPRTVVLEASVAGGAPDCARDPRIANLHESPERIWADVVYDSLQAQNRGGCPSPTVVTVALTAVGPIAGRELVLGHGDAPWVRAGIGFRQCTGGFGCLRDQFRMSRRVGLDCRVRTSTLVR